MKIAILTFHEACNYGAVLQCMALEKALNSMEDVEAEVLDYHAKKIREDYQPWHLYGRNPKNILMMLWMFVPKTIRRQKFRKFVKENIRTSKKAYSRENISGANPYYDCFLTGSDQVWNPICTDGDPTYFLDFVEEASKKMSYAASFGFEKLPEGYSKTYGKLLGEIQRCSIREEQSRKILRELGIEEGEVHIDPVFLMDREWWMQIVKKPGKKHYILLYLLKPSQRMLDYGKKLAAEKGLDIYLINPEFMKNPGISVIKTAGAEEFLGWIYGAELVLTNSFHGLSFCIIFRKQFRAEVEGEAAKTNARLYNLLRMFHMEDCLFNPEEKYGSREAIDFSGVEEILKTEREKAIHYLKSAGIRHRNVQTQIPKKECVGCGACREVCPVNAVTMKADRDGFFYPAVSENRCIGCKACVNLCKKNRYALSEERLPAPEQNFYGVKLKKEEERIKSRSGGLFYALAMEVLSHDGIVYGVGYDKEFLACHKRAADRNGCQEFRGVKYVQSPAFRSFSMVEEDLRAGREVLFSGTPCQVNALKSCLDKRKVPRERLFCLDNVCHGVPSPAIWKDYLSFRKRKKGQPILKVEFRDKAFGWNAHKETICYQDGSKEHSDQYARMFWKDLILRPACYQCPYASLTRCSDITMGDFWGIEKVDPEYDDNKGISLCIVNSEKGRELFEKARRQLTVREYQKEECLQPNLSHAAPLPKEWELFWWTYHTKGIEAVLSRYGSVGFQERTRNYVWKIAKKKK